MPTDPHLGALEQLGRGRRGDGHPAPPWEMPATLAPRPSPAVRAGPAFAGRFACSSGHSSRPYAPDMSATVLLVDDHPLMRRGLAALLTGEAWVARVVEAGTVRDGAAVGAIESVDLAVVDLGLPDGRGVDLVRSLCRNPGCPVLVLTMTTEHEVVRECLDAGATGYLLKDTPPEAVARAAQTVLDGGLVLGPQVAGASLARGRQDQLSAPLDRLGPTDLRLLALLADGLTNGQIAREMHLAEKTVRNRVSRILAVLGVRDRLQAALLARDAGLRRSDQF